MAKGKTREEELKPPSYAFLSDVGRMINADQTHSIILTGNIGDLFFLGDGQSGEYAPLLKVLSQKWCVPGAIVLTYELNGPVGIFPAQARKTLCDAWSTARFGADEDERKVRLALAATERERRELELAGSHGLERELAKAAEMPGYAFEVFRQLCICSRETRAGRPILNERLIFVVEGADMLVPAGEIARLSESDRQRVSVLCDWFSDPGFMNGKDAVVLLAESKSLINEKIAKLPQLLEIEIPAPDEATRKHPILWFNARLPDTRKVKLWASADDLAKMTAGLSIHAELQLLRAAAYAGETLEPKAVVGKVETFIRDQVGEDAVEYLKPEHRLSDVIGLRQRKQFFAEEFIPRLRSTGPEAISGAIVCGPIGVGKTYPLEAIAGELGIVVLVLKNLRSMWYGQTDIIFERLRRILYAIGKCLIFVDEADTVFGGVGPEEHSTERRLTGKIQALMSDTRLRGKVTWLLITARIHLLSPDVRRPGRAGSFIIPMFDPEGEDRDDFIRWMAKPAFSGEVDAAFLQQLREATSDFLAASYADARSELQAKAKRGAGGKLTREEVLAVVSDILCPAIRDVRRYQTLQAMVNCTRKRLLPNPKATEADRAEWLREIRALELKGIT